MKVDLASLAENYIAELIKKLSKMKEYSSNTNFEKIDFHYQQQENCNLDFATDKKDVLYFFKISNDIIASKNICKIIQKKKSKKNSVKYPKVNSENLEINGVENKILYIGKSSTGFHKRLKDHLGLSSASTYSLQLKTWLEDENLMKVKLELYYLPFNFASLEDGFDKNEILELIESSLHYHYKPILGRSGH